MTKKQNPFTITTKTQYAIPRFSYKSAFFIQGGLLLFTLLDLYLFPTNKIALMLTLSISLALLTGIARYFIDTKRGFCLSFYRNVGIIFGLSFGVLIFLL